MRKPTLALCCVVDAHPRFYVECVLWALCATRNLPDHFKPFVYTVGDVPRDLLDWVARQGVEVRPATSVVEGSPHSNKIAPFLAGHDTDFTLVCDADLYWISDPSHLLASARIRAAPNNHACPPPRIFRAILSACGLERPYRPGMALFKGSEGVRETHINNISAGIVVAPRDRTRALAEAWQKWAAWLVGLLRLNQRIAEAVEVIAALPSTRRHLDKFLNPAWVR